MREVWGFRAFWPGCERERQGSFLVAGAFTSMFVRWDGWPLSVIVIGYLGTPIIERVMTICLRLVFGAFFFFLPYFLAFYHLSSDRESFHGGTSSFHGDRFFFKPFFFVYKDITIAMTTTTTTITITITITDATIYWR